MYTSVHTRTHARTHTHTHTHTYVHMHTHMFATQDQPDGGIRYDGVSQPYHLITARGGEEDHLTGHRQLSVGGREWDIKMQRDMSNSCCYQCQFTPHSYHPIFGRLQYAKMEGKAWSILSRERCPCLPR